MNTSSVCQSGFHTYPLEHFNVLTLTVESKALKDNPLGDPSTRFTPLLIPKAAPPPEGFPVVIVLAGFTGNGPNQFNLKTFDRNMPQVIDACTKTGDAPEAVYVFCDAMTAWGGSQFVNSAGTGQYEDYIVQDLRQALLRDLPVKLNPHSERWAVMGASSGGYGALQLVSAHPECFGWAGAIAPDSFFEANIIPELWTVLPALEKSGGVRGLDEERRSGKLFRRRDSHVLLNTVAMGLCYASDGRGDIEFPIDLKTGLLIPEIWKKWKRHDPVVFLRERALKVKQIKFIYMDTGVRDQYHLQLGCRQIKEVLTEIGMTRVVHTEFDGTHFDTTERRPEFWKWLARQWKKA